MKQGLNADILDQKSDDSGRILGLDIRLKGTVYTLCSIYAPTQDKPGEQMANLCRVEEVLEDLTFTNIVVAGDLNCFLDPILDRNSQSTIPSHTEGYRNTIFSLIEKWSLCDIWRLRNPRKTGFTFRRGKYSSRLDYIMISNHLSELADSPGSRRLAHSDHAMISVSLKSSKVKKGPGLWKFNNLLLQSEEFVSQMTTFLSEWEPPAELSDPNVVWEWLKFRIKEFVNKFTHKTYSLEKQHISNLNLELEELYERADGGSEDLTMEIDSVRRELREIEEAKARKIIFKARCNWALHAERPTKYFLNLEKRRISENTLNSLIDEDGSEVTEITDILGIGKRFYENLYKSQEEALTPLTEVREALKELDFPSLPADKKLMLDAPFSEEELKAALSHLNKDKSPGSDGITPEFLTQFWHLISKYFCQSIDFSVRKGRMSSSQRRGMITLIPKKDVDRRNIANWRPIALLNTDYKVFTKALALRLQGVMGLLLHPNQTGFMSGHIIGDSIRVVEDVLEIIKKDRDDGLVAALDFSKAFDSIRWELIYAALERFNFGDSFIKYIKILFVDIESCLINSGTTSDLLPWTGHPARMLCVSFHLHPRGRSLILPD